MRQESVLRPLRSVLCGVALTAAMVAATPAAAALQLDLSPAVTAIVGSSVTFTATLTDGGAPVAGTRIGWVISGANGGATGTCSPADCRTNAAGQVDFTWKGTHPGKDTLKAFVDANGNGMQDGSEISVTCTARWKCPCSSTTTTTTTPSTTTTTLPSGPTPHQCYEIKNFQFRAVTGVTVVDRFGTSQVTLGRPNRVCAPGSTDGAFLDAGGGDDAHLTAYPARDPRFRPVPDVVVTTGYGTLRVNVLQPDFLLVPSAKSLSGPPAALVPPLPDHYQCHFIEQARGQKRAPKVRNVTIVDQFGPYTVDLDEPRRLCAPADVNGTTPGAPHHADAFLCWRGRSRQRFGEQRVWLKDAFSALSVRLIRRQEVCLPATIGPLD